MSQIVVYPTRSVLSALADAHTIAKSFKRPVTVVTPKRDIVVDPQVPLQEYWAVYQRLDSAKPLEAAFGSYPAERPLEVL